MLNALHTGTSAASVQPTLFVGDCATSCYIGDTLKLLQAPDTPLPVKMRPVNWTGRDCNLGCWQPIKNGMHSPKQQVCQ